MKRGTCSTALVAIAVASCRDRSGEPPHPSDGAPTPSAEPGCARRATAKLWIEGGYAINPATLWAPSVSVDLAGRGPEQLVVLPKRPAVPARAEDLCTTQVDPSAIIVTCLGDDGNPNATVVSRAHLADRAGVDRACVDVLDATGARDLEHDPAFAVTHGSTSGAVHIAGRWSACERP